MQNTVSNEPTVIMVLDDDQGVYYFDFKKFRFKSIKGCIFTKHLRSNEKLIYIYIYIYIYIFLYI